MDHLLNMQNPKHFDGKGQQSPTVPSNDPESELCEVESFFKIHVLRKTDKISADKSNGQMKSIEFLLQMSRSIILTEPGANVFCDYIVALMKSHNPFTKKETIVSISIEGGDHSGYFGAKFQPIEEVTIRDVIRCVLHSNNILDEKVPRATVTFMYFNSDAT
ncbi:Protein CBG09918 [Caenorhabditis briggsae]|uniref:Protein CBG09918 n=1 Tax=Caenorhabditis briggsae TaxID=6238 RepID=A8X9Y7_CAEBR|nr:Protein CBG09918 [Caenorhabditis briggsae]CAP29452.1 Protein CBG09918 [Caenorhabditis briggsae]